MLRRSGREGRGVEPEMGAERLEVVGEPRGAVCRGVGRERRGARAARVGDHERASGDRREASEVAEVGRVPRRVAGPDDDRVTRALDAVGESVPSWDV